MDLQKNGSTHISERTIYYELKLEEKQAKKNIPKNNIDIEISHDYNRNLLQVLHNACRKARTYSTVKSIDGFLNIITKIVTSDCLGSRKNVKGFLKLVKLKMYASANECVYTKDLLLPFEITDFPYFVEHLKNDREKCEIIFLEVILWLFSNIVDRMIFKLFRNIAIGNRKLNYVTQSAYQSFCVKAINNLLKKKFIEIVPKIEHKCEGKLSFIAKKSVEDFKEHRVIYTRFKTENYSLQNARNIKQINKYLHGEARRVCDFVKTKDLHIEWYDYVKKIGDRKIYGVKLDLTDAFGHVKMDELYEMIANTERFSKKHFEYIKSINNIAKIDFRQPGVCYKWTHGLLQGQSLSTSLFALYRSHEDRKFLLELNTKDAFFFRVVDDYLYCNTDPTLVKRFLEVMMHNNEINMYKTTLILPQNIQNNNKVIFSGAKIDLETKMIKFAYKLQGPLHHRFKFWNIKRPIKDRWMLLEKQTAYSANHMYFSKLFHFKYNNRDTRYHNFFCGMIMVAYRFDCVLQSIDHPLEITQDKIHNHIKKTVCEYVRKIRYLWRFMPKKGQKILLLKVGFKAFLLVLQRRHQAYAETICNLKRDINAIILLKIGWHIFHKTCGSIPNEYSQICIHRKMNDGR